MSHVIVSLLMMFYAGLIAGVSFFATPVKFRVKSLSRSCALEVGRCTFRAFHYVERVVILTSIVIAYVGALGAFVSGVLWAMFLILMAQSYLLAVPLESQLQSILKNEETEGSSLSHRMYIALELLKLSGAIVLSIHRIKV